MKNKLFYYSSILSLTLMFFLSSSFICPSSYVNVKADTIVSTQVLRDENEVISIVEMLNQLKESGLSDQITALFLYWQSTAVQLYDSTLFLQLWDKFTAFCSSDATAGAIVREIWESQSTTGLATVKNAVSTDVAIDVSYTVKGNSFFKKFMKYLLVGSTLLTVGLSNTLTVNPDVVDSIDIGSSISLNYCTLSSGDYFSSCFSSSFYTLGSNPSTFNFSRILSGSARLVYSTSSNNILTVYLVSDVPFSYSIWSPSIDLSSSPDFNFSVGFYTTSVEYGSSVVTGFYPSLFITSKPIDYKTVVSFAFGSNSSSVVDLNFWGSTSEKMSVDEFNEWINSMMSETETTSKTTAGADDTKPQDENGEDIDKVENIDDLVKVINYWSTKTETINNTTTVVNNYPVTEIKTEYKTQETTDSLVNLDNLNDLINNEENLNTKWSDEFNNALNSIDVSCYSLPSCTLQGLKSVSNSVTDVLDTSNTIKATAVFITVLGMVFLIL